MLSCRLRWQRNHGSIKQGPGSKLRVMYATYQGSTLAGDKERGIARGRRR